MLTITEHEKKILDRLLTATPKVVAQRLGIKRQAVYSTLHNFKRKAQNAEEFLAVARGKYGLLLRRRLNTPKIMPLVEEEA